MRHDVHYVDSLVFREGELVGRMLPLSQITANPEQPRRDMGDLEQLTESVRRHGVLEPILVKKTESGYQIISGERRYLAAQRAALDRVPCVVKDLDEQELLEVALVENLQRKDLHPFEEADGFCALADRYGYTHERIAETICKSRSLVSETMALSALSEVVRRAALDAGIAAKSMLLAVAKLETQEAQLALIEKIAQGATRAQARQQTKKQAKPKPYVFRFRDPDRRFSFDLKFRKSDVSTAEVVDCLERIVEDLKRDP